MSRHAKLFSVIILAILINSSIWAVFQIQPVKTQSVEVNSWSQFQHDAQHTGRSSTSGLVPGAETEINVLFGVENDNILCGSPVIDTDGTIYFGWVFSPSDRKFYALFPDGTQKWVYQLPNVGSFDNLLSSPAVSEQTGTVYFRYGSYLYAINKETGVLRWQRSSYYFYGDHLVLSDSGILYFTIYSQLLDGTYHIYLVGLNEIGEEILSFDIGILQEQTSTPTIDKDGTIYLGYLDTLFAIDPDGTEKWTRTFVGDYNYNTYVPKVQTPSIADDGTIYVVVESQSDWISVGDHGSYDHIHAIDPEDPTIEKWPLRRWKNIGVWAPSLVIGSTGNIYFVSAQYVPGSGLRYTLVIYNSQAELINTYSPWAGGQFFVDDSNTVHAITGGSGNLNLRIVDNQGDIESYYLGTSVIDWSSVAIGPDGTVYVNGRKNLLALKSINVPPPENILPTAFFTCSPPPTHNIVNGELVLFDASGSQDTDGQIISYSWDFGDGTSITTTSQTVTHAFASQGVYSYLVTLTVVDDMSGTDSYNLIVGNEPPVASFTCSSTNPEIGEEIILDASDSSDPDGKIKVYEWDLNGDGLYEGATTNSKIYYYWTGSGIYSVALRVTDFYDGSSMCSNNVIVQESYLKTKRKDLFDQKFLEVIKSELGIVLSDSSSPFYGTNDEQLLFVLNRRVQDAAYRAVGSFIQEGLHNLKLADDASLNIFAPDGELDVLLKYLQDVDVWDKYWEDRVVDTIDTFVEYGCKKIDWDYFSTISGVISTLYTVADEGANLRILYECQEKASLWNYFHYRDLGYAAELSFELIDTLWPKKYTVYGSEQRMADYYESLWIEYGSDNISVDGGLKPEFKQEKIAELRALLLGALESYKFQPY